LTALRLAHRAELRSGTAIRQSAIGAAQSEQDPLARECKAADGQYQTGHRFGANRPRNWR